MQVNILEAKNSLSSLIVAVERDEEVVIARNGVPVAKLVKYTPNKVAHPGAWKGRVAYAMDWNCAKTNAEIEQLFTNSNNAPAA
jgi:prevent-host-death family protein